MLLTRANGQTIRDPTEADITAELAALDDDGDYVILEQSSDEYMQFSGGQLEYRHAGRQFRADPEPASRDTALAAFRDYLKGSVPGLRNATWRDVTEEIGRGNGKSLIVIGMIALVIVALVLYLRH